MQRVKHVPFLCHRRNSPPQPVLALTAVLGHRVILEQNRKRREKHLSDCIFIRLSICGGWLIHDTTNSVFRTLMHRCSWAPTPPCPGVGGARGRARGPPCGEATGLYLPFLCLCLAFPSEYPPAFHCLFLSKHNPFFSDPVAALFEQFPSSVHYFHWLQMLLFGPLLDGEHLDSRGSICPWAETLKAKAAWPTPDGGAEASPAPLLQVCSGPCTTWLRSRWQQPAATPPSPAEAAFAVFGYIPLHPQSMSCFSMNNFFPNCERPAGSPGTVACKGGSSVHSFGA